MEMQSKGAANEWRLDHLSHNGSGTTDSADVDQLLSSFDYGNFLEDLGPLNFGDGEDLNEVDAVLDEAVDEQPRHLDPALIEAAFSSVPGASAAKKGRQKDNELKNLTEEDFEEGIDRLSFKAIKANVECLFNPKAKNDMRLKAAVWIFGNQSNDFDVEKCCLVLGARKDVLLLRIHYEFWNRWIVYSAPLPFPVTALPNTVEGEIYMLTGMVGFELASAAWVHPGIRTGALIELTMASTQKSEEKIRAALEMLSERYLLSQINDSWYVTGRNPALRSRDFSDATYRLARDQVSWSRLF